MDLLIKGGEVVTSEERYVADILCEDGKIGKIGTDLPTPPDVQSIDASGMFVFPGFIDPHVHVYLPSTGTFGKDSYETASKAALLGGTTCFMEFILPAPGEEPLKAWETWKAQGEGRSACDYSFHMAVSKYDGMVESQLREIVGIGIPSFKIHLAYKNVLGLTDEELYYTLGLARELGVLTLGHCENADAIALLRARFRAEGKRGTEWHYHTRPPIVEAEGTNHFLMFAELQGAHAYVAHLSCAESLRMAHTYIEKGNPVWIETLIQFLLIDRTYAERPDFEGAKYVMSPPLRDKSNHPVLWAALKDGAISTVSTDHAPFDFSGQKEQGRDDFTKIPSGLPGIQDRVDLLFTHGVGGGHIDLHRFVDVASTQAAKLFGLYPRKGTVAVGSDADLVIYDPDKRRTISSTKHAMNVDYNAFEGWDVTGGPRHVTVRGELAVENGNFVGSFGYGQFVPREPTHF